MESLGKHFMSKKLIKCEINNQVIEVPEGTSVISAFKKYEQSIAHYCWHPGLSVAGVCRLCMVEIEGMPKLQIACNTEVKEGMKINNQSEKVKAAVKWGLEFHLINHPLDCPICDQAGECELQEQYMRFGQYNPNMAERKVKKRKVVDLGSKIVLDTERCILCSRCVRFTDEVSKTKELGIFHRGDKSEIGVFKDKPLENDYAVNTVDICPVGALTSKDFRFKQRVWYLKQTPSVCIGCSTGCNIELDYNEEGVFRMLPRYNEKINQHWICDKGRALYSLPNPKNRLLMPVIPLDGSLNSAKENSAQLSISSLFSTLKEEFLKACKENRKQTSFLALQALRTFFVEKQKDVSIHSTLILTAQYTNEEYKDFISFFLKKAGTVKDIYYWQNNPASFEEFDGLLLRGDKNPNTKGLLKILKEQKAFQVYEDLASRVKKESLSKQTTMSSSLPKEISVAWVAGPENQTVYPDLKEKVKYLEDHYDHVIWWVAHPLPVKNLKKTWQIPTKTFAEKTGSFVNALGIEQKIQSIAKAFSPVAVDLSETALLLNGEDVKRTSSLFFKDPLKTNFLTSRKRAL